MSSNLVMDAAAVERALVRMAHEILEKNKGAEGVALVGIQTRGVILAERLEKEIQKITSLALPLGILDINLYRDDILRKADQPLVHKTDIRFNLDEKIVVLVCDCFEFMISFECLTLSLA